MDKLSAGPRLLATLPTGYSHQIAPSSRQGAWIVDWAVLEATICGCLFDVSGNSSHCISPWTVYAAALAIVDIDTGAKSLGAHTLVLTPEGPPVQPLTVAAFKTSSTAIEFHIIAPAMMSGIVQSVSILVSPSVQSLQSSTDRNVVLIFSKIESFSLMNHQAVTTMVEGLVPNMLYNLSVTYATALGTGPAAWLLASTQEAVPAKMHAPILLATSGQRVEVAWLSPPMQLTALSYEVEFICGQASLALVEYRGNETSYAAMRNPSDGSYRVRAINGAGAGEWSDFASLQAVTFSFSSNSNMIQFGSLIGGGLLILIMIGAIYFKRWSRNRSPFAITTDMWEIPRETVLLLGQVGKGAFSVVFQGELAERGLRVAVKQISTRMTSESNCRAIEEELGIMKYLSSPWHPNVRIHIYVYCDTADSSY